MITPAARFPRSTWVSRSAWPATVTTFSCGVCSSWRSSAAPSGPEPVLTTPSRGVDPPPKVAPSTRISTIGKTKAKKMLARARNMRRRLTSAIQSTFMASYPR